MAQHRPLTFFLIIFNAVILVVHVVFSTLAFLAPGENNALFKFGVGRSDSREYPSEIQPAPWAFGIWVFIFLFQVLWVIYTFTLLCRKNQDTKDYLYCDPPFIPASFYAVNILALVVITVWLFTWDAGYVSASFVSLFAGGFSLIVCLFFSMYYLWEYEHRLSIMEMWVNILLVQNSLGLYIGWLSIASMLNLSSVFTSDTDNIGKEDAGTICLSIVLTGFLLFICFDIFLSKKRLRYFISPYIVVIFALSAVVNNNWDVEKRNAIYTVAILAIACVGFLAKIISMIYRIVMDPLRIEKMCCQ